MSSAILYSQQRIAAAPAYLQLNGLTGDGAEISATSHEVIVLYEAGYAKGQLPMNTVSSTDMDLNDLILTVSDKTVFFNIVIPEGKFAFGDTMEEEFTTQGEIIVDDSRSEFAITLIVSHHKTSSENIFQVTGQGRLSLMDHFGVQQLPGVQDSFAFMFSQNVKAFTP
jgi:hypothetical protein